MLWEMNAVEGEGKSRQVNSETDGAADASSCDRQAIQPDQG